jgi:hypothetical protein
MKKYIALFAHLFMFCALSAQKIPPLATENVLQGDIWATCQRPSVNLDFLDLGADLDYVFDSVAGKSPLKGYVATIIFKDTSVTNIDDVFGALAFTCFKYLSAAEEPQADKSAFTVFPNPARDDFYIRRNNACLASNARLRLCDTQGRVVFEKTGISRIESVYTSVAFMSMMVTFPPLSLGS